MSVRTAQRARRATRKAPMAPGPCRQAYLEARDDLRRRPALAASHHYDQIGRALASLEGTLMEVAKSLRDPRSYPPGLLLGECTTDDRALWLKGLPKTLAWFIGRVAPATGSPSVEARFQAFAAELLKDCELVGAVVRPSIENEYRAMRCGESAMLPLILRTRALVDLVVAEMPPH